MIVSVHQSHYLPWLGYFDKVDCADKFVILDTVQYEKNGWQNRNKIKSADGWLWLTVPVQHKFGTSITETRINNNIKWAKKHKQALVTNYSRAPFFKLYEEYFQKIYSQKWEHLSGLNDEMFRYFIEKTGIKTELIKVSALGELSDNPNQRLAQIVKKLGGDVYLAGKGSMDYLCEEPFRDAGISVIFQDYKPARYSQLYGDFIPCMSVVDALFNVGGDILKVIREGRRTEL